MALGERVVEILLVMHVAAGVIALVTALIAASNKKGAKNHRRVGTVFFWSMLAVGVTAIPVTFVRPNPFLFFIALFSFYMAFAGYRRGKARFQAERVDTIAASAMIVFAVVMIGYGVMMAVTDRPLGWALVAFGGLGLSFGLRDAMEVRRAPSHLDKVQVHLSRMLGGTIATVTAVLVQQVTPLVSSPVGQLALWLGPTIVLTPLIVLWSWRIQVTKRYRLLPAKV